ncbi:Acyl-CoA dehydrogenase/oxidase domain protein [Cystobacter fuscus]|uniref:Acyl-CoA dehydrogenase n=3 Tax=Archangiaceae TaxID=39 RepID=A0A1L9ATU2_9BACT|nr:MULTISPECIES: acyl-CoA/acyl-ACP dehydrogenase [Archangiaceae]ATB30420.1 Acyl-CoA dehydrogenase/oxidase domain protein [Melittangium boletus DSM 14713]ATB42222.1 Acyl-CoA dehydrogenase/oxidase domain protein [Cystobacter fuscus]OJH33429.1 acyl-CoA dehydrogenase [Cystobacter ferrugineus]WNG27439.1 acyl-CoA dehydrogenase [Cystobacter fuscus]
MYSSGLREQSAHQEEHFSIEALQLLLGRLEGPAEEPVGLAPARGLQQLLSGGFGALPLPGRGQTLLRWRALAAVAAVDLGLIKLFEGHTDALAILAELGAEPPPAGSSWGVWASEPPQARVRVSGRADGRVELSGRKAWCSGAPQVSHALVTAWDAEERQCLVAVAMKQAGVRVTKEGWHAVGMASSASVDVLFEGAVGTRVGPPGGYTARPGFWQGGAGIAACWYGAAAAVGETLRAHCARREEPHARAHLGAVDTALGGARALLREAAAWIDAHPREDASLVAWRARAGVEAAAELVLRHTGRAVGAGPYCRDARVARRMADLPVFLRQSHAERDLEALAGLVVKEGAGGWSL